MLVSTPEWATASSVAQGFARWREQHATSATSPTIVTNRATSDREHLRVARTALDKLAGGEVVTIPHEAQLPRMLDAGTFALGALARPTRLGARRLAVSILGHIK